MTTFSIIVPTRNRPDELQRLLKSLFNQTFNDFEVIIVDQSDKILPNTYLNNLNEKQIILIHDYGKGVSRARNIGLSISQGRIVAFPDDDAWYPPNLLEYVLNFFLDYKEIALLSGIYGEPDFLNPRFPKKSGPLSIRNFLNCVSSVTLFIHRDRLKTPDVLYFDERLGVGTSLPAAEEMDLVLRLLKTGNKGWYDPKFVIFHRVERLDAKTQWQKKLDIEKANHYFLMRAGLKYRDILILCRIIGRLIRPFFSAFMGKNISKQVFRARLRGYKMAIRDWLCR